MARRSSIFLLARIRRPGPRAWDDAFAYAEEKGVVVVASAGNRGSGITQVGAPATIPGVLTVGGVDRQREASKGSFDSGYFYWCDGAEQRYDCCRTGE